ncbi:MAG: acetate--CoA ligase family protein, partial [Clostridia bacterium]|nr:acetate--CoA ligase family protein [Clostridia bacterium]
MNPKQIIRHARAEGRHVLLEDEAKEVLEATGLATARCYRVKTKSEAREVAARLGFPVVLKIRSPSILHKSDVGGVVLNLASEEEVARAYDRLLAIGLCHDPGAGILVQKMAPPGTELIVGVTTDQHFGAVIMLGLGGLFTEVLQDVNYRLLPIGPEDAKEMIASLRAYPVLAGYRGQEAVDLAAVEQVLLKVCALATEYPEIKELDLNPLVAYSEGNLVLDARIVL